MDKFESPFTSPASNQYPFPPIGSPQSAESSRRHGRRRGSTASSITSIGGVLDTATQDRETIAETGNNGILNLKLAIHLRKLTGFPYSDCNSAPAADCANGSRSLCIRCKLAKASLRERHSASHAHQHPSHRAFRFPTLFETSRVSVRGFSARKRGRWGRTIPKEISCFLQD